MHRSLPIRISLHRFHTVNNSIVGIVIHVNCGSRIARCHHRCRRGWRRPIRVHVYHTRWMRNERTVLSAITSHMIISIWQYFRCGIVSFDNIVGSLIVFGEFGYENIVECQFIMSLCMLDAAICVYQNVDVIVNVAYLLLDEGIAAACRWCHVIDIWRFEMCARDIGMGWASSSSGHSSAVASTWQHINHHNPSTLTLVLFRMFTIIVYKYFGE